MSKIIHRNEYHDRHFRRQSQREHTYIPFARDANVKSAVYMKLCLAASFVIMSLVALNIFLH